MGKLRPTVTARGRVGSPAGTFDPGANIIISCPVTSNCNRAVDIQVELKIYEGSIFPGHGTLLQTQRSPTRSIEPGQTLNFEFTRTTVVGTIDRRDVGVEVHYWDGSTWVLGIEEEWDDVYYVKGVEAIPEIELVGITWESDPEFYTGTTHRARLTVRNPTPWDWLYGIYLGSYAFVQPYGYWSGIWPQIPLAAGETRTLVTGEFPGTFDITMVDTPGVYEALVRIIERTHDPADPNAVIATILVEPITLVELAVPEEVMLDADQVVTVMGYVYWWPTDEAIKTLVAPMAIQSYGGYPPTGPLAPLRYLGFNFYAQCGGGYPGPMCDMVCFNDKRDAWWDSLSEAKKQEWRETYYEAYKMYFLQTYAIQWVTWAPISPEDLMAMSGNPEKCRWAIENLLGIAL